MRKPEMRKSGARTVRRAVLGTWLAAGVLATGYGSLLTGCASTAPGSAPMSPPSGEIDSVEKAEQAWRAGQIAEYEPIWNEENGPHGDPFSAGLAAWHLASVTEDPAWSGKAIDIFDKVLDRMPDFTLARAWRGSAHALAARDYPIQGLWQIVPGPGFVRLYHVRAAFSDLDEAVGAAPDDPAIRLIRGSTYLGMPSIFGGADEGLADFDALDGWTRDPESNPDQADVLRSMGWRESYYLSRSRAMERIGRDEDAARSWMRLAGTTDDPILQELAKWHRTSLGASR